jgi:hypothetical protein
MCKVMRDDLLRIPDSHKHRGVRSVIFYTDVGYGRQYLPNNIANLCGVRRHKRPRPLLFSHDVPHR